MLTGKKLHVVALYLLILFGMIGTARAGKSVYVISNTNDGMIRAYEVQDSNLVYQAQYNSDIIYSIGLAIDPNAEFLFVTHEAWGLSKNIEKNQHLPVQRRHIYRNSYYFADFEGCFLAGIAVNAGKCLN